MLVFKRNESSDHLAEQFGIEAAEFEKAAELWEQAQKKIIAVLENSLDPQEGGFEFDATEGFKAFLSVFDTQELQDIALVQFIMQDLADRAKSFAFEKAKDKFTDMLKGLGEAIEEEHRADDGAEDADYEEIL